MFYIFNLFVFLMQPFEHFNVIALYKLNIIIIIYHLGPYNSEVTYQYCHMKYHI